MTEVWQESFGSLALIGAHTDNELTHKFDKKMAGSIIIALITAGFPTLTTAITAVCQSRATKKNAAKQSILQMIMEDHMAIQEKKLPTNYQNVLHEFDIYKKNGGNSYMEEKVTEYKKWFAEVEQHHQG